MQFKKESIINASPERVFGFHELPDAFERLIPPWENTKIIQRADISEIGSQVIIEQTVLGFFKQRLVAEHTKYDPPRMFEDRLVSGPFKRWVHQHIVEPHDDGAVLRDEIEYEMGLSYFGLVATPLFVLPKLKKMFDFRHEVTKNWCESENSGLS